MTMLPSYPTIIGHMDTLYNLYHLNPGEQTIEESISRYFFEHAECGHIDYPRALEGVLAGAFFAIYVPQEKNSDCTAEQAPPYDNFSDPLWYLRRIEPAVDPSYAQRVTMTEMARLIQLETLSQGKLKIVRTVTEIEQSMQAGILSAIMHIEGAEGLDTGLNNLEIFYRAGLRSLGPVWSRHNAFGYGVPFVFGRSPDAGPGLTDAGKALVRACNRLGILLDLSHLNEQGFWDVARLSQAPLVATHSNAFALCPSTRNLTDKQLDAIRASDGLVGINFNVRDLREDGARNADTPLDDIIRHTDYLVERLGIDRVALGTDYDGALMPDVLSDVSKLPLLYSALAQHGYDDSSLRKLASENWLRIFRQIWHNVA